MKVLKAIICILLAGVLIFGITNFLYYPKYKLSKAKYDVSEKQEQSAITAVSANVRCWSPTDVFKKSWFYRADLLFETLKEQEPDIIGFQEVSKIHYKYLTKKFEGYGSVIKYRDDSPLAESCPIFYNKSRFDCADSGGFWLSETPDIKSKDWGAACYRICSYVILKQKSDGSQLVVFNTHLDHISDEARINGINVVHEKIKQFGSLPSIIMGDFNAEEDSQTYSAVTKLFDDAKYKTSNPDKSATYQNFGKELESENIDYFMISKTGIEVKDYRIIKKTYDGVYPSDHFPIKMEFTVS
ncbi:MAG: endonuclease/exonuclease/phosphatase family protein [Clostridia bacterium]|nr:endonuclease/exonuclease/phosphatase family protein [Clostridia bacterium]